MLRRLVCDLNYDVDVIVGPTVRETDGLALSSRNVYLSADERAVAPAVYAALRAVTAAYERGERSTEALGTCAAEVIAKQPTMSLDYLSLASLDDGRELTDDLHPTLNGAGVLASIAVKLGGTRLIDNVVLPA